MSHQPYRAGSVAIAIALALIIVLPGEVLAITWGPNRQLTDRMGDGVDSMVCRGGLAATSTTLVHAAYTSFNIEGGHEIDPGVWYRRSVNGGAGWGGPVRISTGGFCLGLTASGSSVNVLWRSEGLDGPDGFWLSHSSDTGLSWGEPTAVTTVDDHPGDDARIAQFGGRVAVTWTNQATGATYLTRSTDAGATFDAGRCLWQAAQVGATPPIPSYATGSLYLLYTGTGGRLRIRRSPDYGTTWPMGVTVAPHGGTAAIASVGATVVVTYGSYVRRSSDKGTHWSAAVKLGYANRPLTLAYRGGRFMVLYQRPGPPEMFWGVWYRQSTNGGQSWTAPVRASSTYFGDNWPGDVDIAGRTLVLYSAGVEEFRDVFVRLSR